MCALIGARNQSSFEQLVEVNRYRGELNHSVAGFVIDEQGYSDMHYLTRKPGPYTPESFPTIFVDSNRINERMFFVGHTQAPTAQVSNIHPAEYKGAFLWHNGIVKQKEVDGWDTLSILKGIRDKGFRHLSNVDGTFACILYMDSKLYVFRNEIAPLFYDHISFSLSSTKTEKGFLQPLPPNEVFAIEMQKDRTMQLRFVSAFTTKENPYFFMME